MAFTQALQDCFIYWLQNKGSDFRVLMSAYKVLFQANKECMISTPTQQLLDAFKLRGVQYEQYFKSEDSFEEQNEDSGSEIAPEDIQAAQ